MKRPDGGWEGISVDLLDRVSKKIGRDYILEEKNLPELFKSVKSSEADVGVSALSVTAGRERDMDFTHSYFTSRLSFISHKTDAGFWSGVAPFFSVNFLKAMAALASLILLFAFLVWIFERKKNATEFGSGPAFGLGAAFWWSAVTMTTVGYGDKTPKTFMGRFISIIWMFTAVIVISSFTAAITTSLTVQRIDQEIDSLLELRFVKVAVVQGTTGEKWAEQAGLTYQKVASSTEGINKLEQSKVDVLIDDEPVLKYLTHHESHKYNIVSLPGGEQRYALALPKGSELRKEINVALLEVLENGNWKGKLQNYFGDFKF